MAPQRARPMIAALYGAALALNLTGAAFAQQADPLAAHSGHVDVEPFHSSPSFRSFFTEMALAGQVWMHDPSPMHRSGETKTLPSSPR